MRYDFIAIAEDQVPLARDPAFQHILDTYLSETNKVISTWRSFGEDDLCYRPDPKSATVLEILRHQILSERRFFGEFLGCSEPPADQVLPNQQTVEGFCRRVRDLALPRIVDADVLPGRGVNIYQIRAWFPDLGVVNVLVSLIDFHRRLPDGVGGVGGKQGTGQLPSAQHHHSESEGVCSMNHAGLTSNSMTDTEPAGKRHVGSGPDGSAASRGLNTSG
jgi:hypothetical protein